MGVALSPPSSFGRFNSPKGSRGVAVAGGYTGGRTNYEPVCRYLDDSSRIFCNRSVSSGTSSLCKRPRTTFPLSFNTRIDRRPALPEFCIVSLLASAVIGPNSFDCHDRQSRHGKGDGTVHLSQGPRPVYRNGSTGFRARQTV